MKTFLLYVGVALWGLFVWLGVPWLLMELAWEFPHWFYGPSVAKFCAVWVIGWAVWFMLYSDSNSS